MKNKNMRQLTGKEKKLINGKVYRCGDWVPVEKKVNTKKINKSESGVDNAINE